MENSYFSIKVTVSPLTGDRYRSRIEQVPKGASFGAGNDFDLIRNQSYGVAPSIEEFKRQIHMGTPPNNKWVGEFGKWLFGLIFQGNVLAKYSELKGIAGERRSQFRICLSLHSPDLMNVPWEYLHDGSNFLLDHGYSIVRVMDELEGARSSFSPIRTALVAVANPAGDDYDQFKAPEHVKAMRNALDKSKVQAKILEQASAESLLDAIQQNAFDMLYFVGHGEASEFGSRLICEASDHTPECLDANDLAKALRQAGNTRFVYLNSCSTAKASESNPFAGVAQRLMLDGNVAAVAAMQVDIRQEAGIKIAEAFLAELAARSPEDSMLIARGKARDGYSFAIPALYTYVDAPEQLRKNRLYTFLSADDKSKFAIVLPSFELGLLAGEESLPAPSDGRYRFPGETYARTDTESALYVSQLLTEIVPPEHIRVSAQAEGLRPEDTHYFLLGSKSNPKVQGVLQEFSKKFSFDYAGGEHKDQWVLTDLEYSQTYSIHAPDKLGKEYEGTVDFGVIQKITNNGKVYFVLAGLGSRATQGCGWYLLQRWPQHVMETDFAIVLRFPGNLDFASARVINRKTGKPENA